MYAKGGELHETVGVKVPTHVVVRHLYQLIETPNGKPLTLVSEVHSVCSINWYGAVKFILMKSKLKSPGVKIDFFYCISKMVSIILQNLHYLRNHDRY